MFSRIVPWNSHVSWRTIPNDRRRSSRVMVAGVDAVDRDPPAVELVEPHQQVDERRLAGPGRTDDGDGHAGLDVEVEVARSAARSGS